MKYYTQENMEKSSAEIFIDSLFYLIHDARMTEEEKKEKQEMRSYAYQFTHIDYEAQDALYRQQGIKVEPSIMRYLPESLVKYVKDGRLPPADELPDTVIEDAKEKCLLMRKEWDDFIAGYIEEQKNLAKYIPLKVRKYINGCLHDSLVCSISRPESDQLMIILDTSASYIRYKKMTMLFKGVKLLELPPNMAGSWWLYDEYHLSDSAKFSVQVLLHEGSNLNIGENIEFRVDADEFEVKFKVQ